MKATNTIVRVVFMVLVLVTYARPALAGPHWQEYCDTHCNGQVRVWECSFVDNNDYFFEESECFGSDPYDDADAHYYYLCYQYAGGGGGTNFHMLSCQENPSRGSFYCSYDDISCGQ